MPERQIIIAFNKMKCPGCGSSNLSRWRSQFSRRQDYECKDCQALFSAWKVGRVRAGTLLQRHESLGRALLKAICQELASRIGVAAASLVAAAAITAVLAAGFGFVGIIRWFQGFLSVN